MTETGSIHHGRPPRGPSVTLLSVLAVVTVLAVILGIVVGPKVHTWLAARTAADKAAAADGTWYISQMHPWIIQPTPGTCPICGMDLVPVDPDRFAGEIAIDPVVVQNMGVRIVSAERGDITRTIRSIGTVTVDDGQVTDVVQRFAGWVESVHVSQWQQVTIGDPLFDMYAPMVFTAEQDYLIAQTLGSSAAAAAITKLELLGIPQEEISRLQAEDTARDRLTVRSPATGVVWERPVVKGAQLQPMTVAYRIVDLSQVWVEITLYESDVPNVSVGASVGLQLGGSIATTVTGTIAEIYPQINATTREIRARVVVANADPQDPLLKPGMFVTAQVGTFHLENVVRVPREAIIGTGKRRVAFISLGRGRFEARDVQLGLQGDDGLVEIVDGISAGEAVVISGQFLLDSESRMREALVKVMKGDLAVGQKPAMPAASTATTLVALDSAAGPAWREVLNAAVAAHDRLYQEDGDAEAAIFTLKKAGEAFVAAGKASNPHFHHVHPEVGQFEKDLATVTGGSIENIRKEFGTLSVTLNALIKIFGQPDGFDLVGMHCGMYKSAPEGGVWLQPNGAVANPYFGQYSGMKACAADNWSVPRSGGQAQPPASSAPPASAVPAPEQPAREQPASDTTQASASNPRTAIDSATISAYTAVAEALYAGHYEHAIAVAAPLDAALAALAALAPLIAEDESWSDARAFVEALQQSNDLQTARVALGNLGVLFRDQLQHGSALKEVRIFRCGMARDFADNGVWIQMGAGEPHNPFFGDQSGMSACASTIWKVTTDGLVEVE